MKKVMAALLSAVLLCSAIIAGLASGKTEEDKILLDFNNPGPLGQVASTWADGGIMNLSLQEEAGSDNTRLKETFIGANTENGNVSSALFISLKTKDWSGNIGLSFWIKNTSANKIWLDMYIQDTNGKRYGTQNGADIFLLSDGSETPDKAEFFPGANRIYIPAGFSGKVSIPFTSLTDSFDPAIVHEICISSDANENKGVVLYYDDFKVYSDTSETLLQDFEGEGTIDTFSYIWTGGAIIERSLEAEKSALRIDISGPNPSGQSGAALWLFAPDKDWSGADGILFKLDNSANNGVFPIDIAMYSGSTSYKIKSSGAVAYLTNENGKTTNADFNTYRMNIAAGFKGTVRIPFTSFNQGFNLADITRFELATDASVAQGFTILLDDIALYSEDNTSSGTSSVPHTSDNALMIQDFELSDITDAISIWSGGATVTPSFQSDSLAEGSTKGCKLEYGDVNGSQTGSVTFITIMNTDWRDTNGIRFWVENKEKESPIDFDIFFTDSSNPEADERWVTKNKSDIIYFDTKTGTYEKASFNYRLRIPAGFAGWIEVPFTSFEVFIPISDDAVMDLSKITQFAIGADNASVKGTTLYLDDIQLYKTSLTESWKAPSEEPNTSGSSSSSQSNNSDTPDTPKTPDTGDDTFLFLVPLAIAAGTMIIIKKAKRYQN